tara:strand:- start:1121 stop:1705 length:585 start_codon:yes stop_codon:yes gene_type:complete
MFKESSKVKELKSIRKGLLKESNDFKNELLNKIFKDLNLSFYVSYNDLYSVKGGECRRLKGWISNYNDDVYNSLSDKNRLISDNEKFNKVKDYLNSKDFGKYEVEICKLSDYSWYWYRNFFLKYEENWGKNWFDYKNEMLEKETTLIIKIKWKGVNMNRVLNEEDGGFRKVGKYCSVTRKWVLTGEIEDLKRVV